MFVANQQGQGYTKLLEAQIDVNRYDEIRYFLGICGSFKTPYVTVKCVSEALEESS